ncbi:hypothetical protein [Reyranella aquatilis]|jgi:hypothetical protein|uniref:Uncharacterized protein n=1 Tax=Reyranella aquatilis TaxID=2035356 RepID=A0ABS8KYZ8_9HYPH|nr:hypothetical protein [Reyranella aquatilis]MCC8431301.1 hypothetical protein [Reyranella aquatilis]
MEILIVVAVFTLGGAAWGWWRGTQNINNPPDKYDFPGGMTRREHLSLLSKKHRRRRIPLTIGAGLASGTAAFVALLAFAVFKR